MMRKSDTDGNDALQKQIVYSFGDHYYMRKDLRILNLLTGYKSFTFLFIPSLAESQF
jgi:ATPase complex subunit ATP10